MTSLPARLQPLFEDTKTVCFGRFVIEIPTKAQLAFGPAEVGPSIFHLSGESSEIARYVAKDLVAMDADRENFDEDAIIRLPFFGKVIDGIIPGQKITFGSKDRVGYYINAYVPVGKDLFVLHYGSVMHQDYDVEDFNVIAKQLRLRHDDDIPAGPGTCIDGGFLPMALEYEKVTLGIRLKEFPDVHLSIEVHKNRDRLDEDGRLELMLESGKETAKRKGLAALYARIKTFRRGTRPLGPWTGYEMVARKPAYKDHTAVHEFRFQSLGALHDPLLPQLDLRLDTGVKKNRTARAEPSLTDEEALALWDKLIGTIRVRQPSDATPRNAAPAKVPLGQITPSGDLCTQQGWWQCIEDDNIEGARRRHFTVGEQMPHAVILAVPNLWQKLSGDQPRHTRPSAWKLVEYDEPAAPLPTADESLPFAALGSMTPALDADAAKNPPRGMG